MTEYEKDLRRLAGRLAEHAPAALVADFVGFLDAGEPDVGLEWLCDGLYDQEIPLTQTQVDLIRSEGEQMGLTRASVLRIGELLAAE